MRTDSRELLAVGIFGAKSRIGDRIEMLFAAWTHFLAAHIRRRSHSERGRFGRHDAHRFARPALDRLRATATAGVLRSRLRETNTGGPERDGPRYILPIPAGWAILRRKRVFGNAHNERLQGGQ
jgi:hypothetical protein